MAQLQSTIISGTLLLRRVALLPQLSLTSGSSTGSVKILANNSLLISASILTPGVFKSTVQSGSKPFDILSPTLVDNLNAQYWNSHIFSDYINQPVRINDDVKHASLTSPAFNSGYFGSGFRLFKNDASLYLMLLDNVIVRGTLFASVFHKDTVRASNGFLFISDCSLIALQSDASENAIYVKLNNFQVNDILWYKGNNSTGAGINISSIKSIVNNILEYLYVFDNTTYSCYKLLVSNTGTGKYTPGNSVVRIGNTTSNRQGSIYFDASSTNAPFMDIYDGVNTVLSFGLLNKLKVRLGNLNGVVDSDFGQLTGHGLYAVDNVYIKGVINALSGGNIAGWNIGLDSLYKDGLLLNSIEGSIKIGDNVYFDKNGTFIIQKDLSNYIKHEDLTFLIKTNNILISTDKLRLSSTLLNIMIGDVYGYRSGSGIFIGRDIYSCPSILNDNLLTSGSLQYLMLDSDTASANNYSNYKMFIGLDSGSYFIYDGRNILLNGIISSSAGIIGGWSIYLNSIAKNNVTLDSTGKIYIGTGTYNNSNTSFYVDKDGQFSLKDKLSFSGSTLKIDGVITSSAGLIGGWTINTKSLLSNHTKILSSTSSYWDSPTNIPAPTDPLLFNLLSSITIPHSASTVAGLSIPVTSSINMSLYSGSAFGVNLVYHYYNTSSNGKYLTALMCMYQISGSQLIHKKTVILQRDSVSDGRYKTIGFLYRIDLFDHTKTFNIKLVVKRADLLLLTYPYTDLIAFNYFLVNTGKYLPLTLLSLNGLFVFNNPESYIKVGANTQFGTNTLDIKADLLVVKNITILLGIYTDAKLYGVTLIAGTTANKFTINSDFIPDLSSIVLNRNQTQFASIKTVNTNLLFKNLLGGKVGLDATWAGDAISLANQVTGTLPVANGGTGLTTILQYKLLTSYGSANAYSATNLSDLFTSSVAGLSLSTTNGYMTMSLAQDITTAGKVQFAEIKVGEQLVVTQDRSIYVTSSNGLTITGNTTQSLSSNIGWKIDHATYSTQTSGTGQFISNITYDNGHISTITKSNFDNSHTHSINNMSYGIGLNITIAKATNSILSVTSANKTVTLDISPAALSFGSGLSSSANTYDAKSAVSIDHKTLASDSFNPTSSINDLVLCLIHRDLYGHITGSVFKSVYGLFTGFAPISISSGTASIATSSNLKLSSNKLDTIQDIQTTSDVTFNSLKIKSSSYLSILNASTNGLNINNSVNVSGSFNIYNNNRNIKQSIDSSGNVIFSIT